MRAIYLAYCMFRELIHRLTGISRESSPVTTLFATAVLAGALHSVIAPILKPLARLRGGRPSLQAAGAALAVGRYLTSTVGGEQLRETPHADMWIALGFVRPALTIVQLPVTLARAAGAGVSRALRWLSAASRRGTA